MARKSEVDKIIERNANTFDKYDSYSDWAKKHLKCDNSKYEDAFNKYHFVEVEDGEETS